MAERGELLGIYLHLARASEARNRPLVRDKLLALAGAIAAEGELAPIAAYCRSKILANNPGHLIGRHPTFAAALADERFQHYLARLRTHYSQERAEHMLQSLGIQLARERAAYFNDYEYAAALLGLSPEALEAAAASPAVGHPSAMSAAPKPTAPPGAAAEEAENPYAPPQTPMAPKRFPLVLGDRWLGLIAILALVVLPLAMILLVQLASWLKGK